MEESHLWKKPCEPEERVKSFTSDFKVRIPRKNKILEKKKWHVKFEYRGHCTGA